MSVSVPLELQSPMFSCGDCHFTTQLTGKWSVEHGQLVFRADADPQPRRGPDLESCCEGRHVTIFTKIVTDTDQEFGSTQLDKLREMARTSLN
jgi:hypothetical protein